MAEIGTRREVRVSKVEVFGQRTGQMLRALTRTSEDKLQMRNSGLGGVVYHTDAGVLYGRVDDIARFNLGISLTPNANRQSYVHDAALETANLIVNQEILPKISDMESRFHQYLPKSALENPYSLTSNATDIDFAHLAFGLNASDVMYVSQVDRGGDWKNFDPRTALFEFQDFGINPAAQALHYSSTIFEGAKAYSYKDGRIVTFRLPANAARFAKSAARVALTPIPEEVFLEAVRRTTLANRRLIAPPGLGAALYIRPFHFGSGPQLGVAPAPSETFCVFVSPVGPYFKGGFGGKKMKVETTYRRSAPGLTGDSKVGPNYAGSIVPGLEAKKTGQIGLQDLGQFAEAKFKALLDHGYIDEHGIMTPFDDKRSSLDLRGSLSRELEDEVYAALKNSHFAEVIYLDATQGQYLEEVGAANAFFVKDNVLYTPRLGTILPGITRDSVIILARELGLKVEDSQLLHYESLLDADEVFCTGTAAAVTPISSVSFNGRTSLYNNGKVGPITQALYNTLVGIQEGTLPDTHNWIYPLE